MGENARVDRRRLEHLSSKLDDTERRVRELSHELDDTKDELERTRRAAEAIWFALRDQLTKGADPSELVQEIDRRMAALEDPSSEAPAQCPTCQRPVRRQGALCVFCGVLPD